MVEISWHLRHSAASCVEVLVRQEDREQCYAVLHMEPQWTLDVNLNCRNTPAGAVCCTYRKKATPPRRNAHG